MSQDAPRREIVLLGAGHTHLHVLRMWAQAPIPGARLTCVTDFLSAAYSGMLPGALAGLYSPQQMLINLVRLCETGGVRLIRAEVAGLDRDRRELVCGQGPPIPFDVLSIGIGSVPRETGVPLDASVMRIKPMQTFLPRLQDRLEELAARTDDSPLRIAVVGGGAGGVEIALCLTERLKHMLGGRPLELSLIDSSHRLLAGRGRLTGSAAMRELTHRKVRVILASAVKGVSDGALTLEDGTQLPADLVLWSTGAEAPPLLAKLGLPTDQDGFLTTRPTLQTLDDPRIFAVGDTGSIQSRPTPKAGVYAVRQGPILWGNLHRTIFGRPLIRYRPQQGFLSLLALGDGRAILSYRGLAITGRWCWRLKNSIDRRFVEQFQS